MQACKYPPVAIGTKTARCFLCCLRVAICPIINGAKEPQIRRLNETASEFAALYLKCNIIKMKETFFVYIFL